MNEGNRDGTVEGPTMEHYLLTSIGTRPSTVRYLMGSGSDEKQFSSTALMNLLEKKPSRIYLLLTGKARETSFEQFRKETDVEIRDLSIPNGEDVEQVEKIVNTILTSIPRDCELTIDITQGLRHLPFLLFVSALYLKSFRNVHIRNIYYGMMEAERDEKPFVDITLLLEMADWFHAVRCFSQEKRAASLVKMLQDSGHQMETPTTRAISKLNEQINLFNEHYGLGLPLGVGDSSKSFIDQFGKKRHSLFHEKPQFPIPLAEELFEYAADSLKPLKLPRNVKTSGEWKKEFKLDIEEIKRQANLIDDYFKTGHYVNAVRFIREWTINRCILSYNSAGCSWLKRDVRSQIERQLGSIKWQSERNILQEDRRELAGMWDSIISFRNVIAHNEMTDGNIDINRRKRDIDEIWGKMKDRIESDDFWNPYTGGGVGNYW